MKKLIYLILLGAIIMGVRLSWNDNNFGEEGHKVYRSTSPMDPQSLPAPLATLGPDVTQYDDGSVVDGTTYYYRVSAYNGAVEAVSDEISILASTSGLPVITIENFILNDENDDLANWSTNSGSPSIVSSELILPSSPSQTSAVRKTIDFPDSNDYLVYFKIRSDVGSNYGYLQFNNGATGVLHFVLGYDWTVGSASANTISASLLTTGEDVKLVTSLDYSVSQEYVMHIDRDRGFISFYRKVSGSWEFEGSLTYNAAVANINTVVFSQGSPTPKLEAGLDYFSIARPNLISIGDSICAGHNGFDPDPSFYAGVDDYDNTWQKHANIYQSLRNNFIVNKGIGSETSAATLARISEATSHTPNVVFLHASSNDYGSATLAQRTTNIQNTIDAITAAGAEPVLLNAMYPNSNHGSYPAIGDYMADWWSNYKSTLTSLNFDIDIMQPVILSGYLDSTYTESDGIHPNVAGYTLIGNYIESLE